MRSPSSRLRQAREFHEAGNAAQAEQMYRHAIAGGIGEACHWLARLLVEQRRFEDALAEAGQAIRLRPNDAFGHEARGLALSGLGRTGDAAGAYERAIELDPSSFGTRYNLGNVYRAAGRLDDAASCYRYAVRLDPGQARTWNNLGDTYRALGQLEDAADAFRAALLLQPHTPEMLFNRASVERDLGRHDAAARDFAAVAALRPDDFAAHLQLGLALGQLGDAEALVSCCAIAARLRPRDATVPTELGGALQKLGRLDEAEAALRAAVALAPEEADTYSNLGNLLHDLGKFDAAAAALAEALRLDPEHPGARYNRSILNLTAGRLAEGFAEYTWRWKGLNRTPMLPGPAWAGEPAADKTLLLYPDQGAGDFIQFSRFAPIAAQRAGAVTLLVSPALFPLFQAFAAPGLTVQSGTWTSDAAAHDLHCPVIDLPHALGVTEDTIPRGPYLAADPALAAAWRSRLSGLRGRRIGLAWAGNPDYPNDRARSMRFAALAPLLQAPDVSFVSLQQGGAPWTARPRDAAAARPRDPAAARPLDAAAGERLHDWTHELTGFADTAALIDGLDLVISVDTSVAHLAGAMGKPVWLLNRYDTDWRWMRDRDDSPWYPAMRIFRQQTPGDWEPVIVAVLAALRAGF